MTRAEKRRFIRDLTRNVARDVLAKVPQMPEEWDGHELRRYIADKFESAAFTLRPSSSVQRFGDPHERRRHVARLRAYRNEVLVRNL